jgi:hypothetical protein
MNAPAVNPQGSTETAPVKPYVKTGIKGGLMLFCFITLAFFPWQTYLAVQLARSMNEELAASIAVTLLGAIAGILVLGRIKQALIAVLVYVAANLLVCLYGLFIFIRYAVNGADVNRDFLGYVFYRILFCVFWFLYFHFSERVKNTFGANLLKRVKT